MKDFFKSEAGKREIFRLYDQKLQELNIPYEEEDILTSFGRTSVIQTGDTAHPPLVVIHGSNGCAPVALEAYPTLAQHYRVFAIDVLAQPNKSEGERLSMKDDSYGRWMNEVIDGLGLNEVTLLGFSFGGLIILKTLINDERRIKAAFLASPAYIVNGNPLKALLRIFLPMKRYMRTKNRKLVVKVVDELFTDRDEFAVQYLSQVFLHFEMDFTPVPVITKAEAKGITTPITLLAAKQDLLFPGGKMIRRARRIFPALREAILLSDSRHVQNRAGNRRMEELVRQGKEELTKAARTPSQRINLHFG
ncbi:MAG: alpha/beta hydrolase [Phaeodactylibacter sp.]|nr:alpha/beta hydrolase [Phaeodactylibacter sp.]MCB9054180.1 alpha/beta hydrolase [Lewinellaceae bacterium]